MTFPLLTADEQTALVERIRAGDAAAEARLVELFSPAIRTMARVRCRGTIDDQDVGQDVLIAAITSIRRGQLRDAERLGGFIAGIARNLINNQLRLRASRPVDPLIRDDVAVADLREEMARRERTRALRAALDEMRPDDRQVLVLTLVEGLKSGEIADRLGLPPDVVRTRKTRAIKRLTERLNGD